MMYPLERNAFLPKQSLPIYDIFPLDSNQIWAVTANRGCILHSEDSGRTWVSQIEPATNKLLHIQFFDRQNGYASGDILLMTTNGGTAWNQMVLPDNFPKAKNINGDYNYEWLTSSNVTLFGEPLDDPRKREEALNDVESQIYTPVQFTTPKLGWYVTAGKLMLTTNGGLIWDQLKLLDNSNYIRQACIFSETNGLALTADWKQFHLDNPNGIWQATELNKKTSVQSSGGNQSFSSSQVPLFLSFENVSNGVLATDSGLVFRTRDGANSWESAGNIPGFDPSMLLYWHALEFKSSGTAWAIETSNGNSSVIASTNGGKIWSRQLTDLNPLWSVRFSDESNGFVTGNDFHVYRTADQGALWEPVVLPYRRLPAPWYWLFALVCIALAMPLLGTEPSPKPIENIEDCGLSDDPIDSIEQDKLEFYPLANGLARFILNPATKPPLTIAITGKWGKGKSSLMKLLQGILSKQGVRPVWFNAWHHQHEEQIFASLMANITEQGVPEWWNPSHWFFRGRLFWLRLKRKLPASLPLLVVFCFLLGLLTRPLDNMNAPLPDRVIGNLRAMVDGTTLITDAWQQTGPVESRLNRLGNLSAGLALSITFCLLIKNLLEKIKAFNINPASLVSKVVPRFGISELENKLSFQLRFGREFQEVTDALKDKQMVIFIDDLDRCQPAKVVEILEAVNFLVSSGKCFVILGLAKEQVEAALALAYSDIAGEIELSEEALNAARPTKNMTQRQRSAFARLYLRKLINMEVCVPSGDEGKLISVVTKPPVLEPVREPKSWLEHLAAKPRVVLFPGVIIFIVGIALFAFSWGYQGAPLAKVKKTAQESGPSLFVSTPPAKPAGSARSINNGHSKTVTGQDSNITLGVPLLTNRLESIRRVGKFEKASPGRNDAVEHAWLAWSFVPAAILIFLTTALVLASRRVQFQFIDSRQFSEALNFWAEELTKAHNTPREMKRYINRVRYISMRKRSQESLENAWELAVRGIARLLNLPFKSDSLASLMKSQQFDALFVDVSVQEIFKNDKSLPADLVYRDIKRKKFFEKFNLPPDSEREAIENDYYRFAAEVPLENNPNYGGN